MFLLNSFPFWKLAVKYLAAKVNLDVFHNSLNCSTHFDEIFLLFKGHNIPFLQVEKPQQREIHSEFTEAFHGGPGRLISTPQVVDWLCQAWESKWSFWRCGRRVDTSHIQPRLQVHGDFCRGWSAKKLCPIFPSAEEIFWGTLGCCSTANASSKVNQSNIFINTRVMIISPQVKNLARTKSLRRGSIQSCECLLVKANLFSF